ncbi:MAG: ferritin family protein [Chloroflexi bacterium]|nr:ferritin family protein [Chloroflexota bacterium]
MIPKVTEISPGKEILELAIEIERNGRDFYTALASKASEKEVQAVFRRLAARELEHENTFRDMLKHLGGYQVPPGYAGEHYQYIRSVAQANIFASEKAKKILASKIMTDVEAIEVGIGFEKDAILFYSEMRGMLPKPDQDIVDAILAEEKKHLTEFCYLADKFRGQVR